jgi:uncharacterized protein with HEPN domain
MSKRDIRLYVLDILIAYNKIERYTVSFSNASDFLNSELHWDATIRELEIVGEATNHLLKDGFLDEGFREIVDFRNQISHGYFGVNEEIVWDVVINELPSYRETIFNIMQASDLNFQEAIIFAEEEYKSNKHILKMLNELKKETL